MENSKNIQSDELNFYDIVSILLKWKWILLGVWGLVLVISYVYISIAKPVYQSKAVMYIGEYPIFAKSKNELVEFPTKQVEKPYVLVEKLNNMKEISAKWDSDKPDLIEIVAESDSSLGAFEKINKIIKSVMDEHASRIHVIKQRLDEQKRYLEKSRDDISREIKFLDKESKAKSNSGSINVQLAIEKLNLLVQQEKSDLIISALVMNDSLIRETSIVVEPKQGSVPVKPNKKLVILAAIVFGLVIGVLTVFMISFITNNRDK